MQQLDNLVRIGQLKPEPAGEGEIEGLVRSAEIRLKDAARSSNALESRFDLAYNGAHAVSLAALRLRGYRSENRYLVFQTLIHTVELSHEDWRVLDAAHRKRNTAEYEGVADVDEATVAATLRVANEVLVRVRKLLPKPRGRQR